MLDWSVEALAFRSGVSPKAIRRIARGAELRRVTMQALAYAMELEGLVPHRPHSLESMQLPSGHATPQYQG